MLRIKLTHANEHMQKAASCVNLNAIGTKKKFGIEPIQCILREISTHTTNPDSDNKIKFYESKKEIEKNEHIKEATKLFDVT